MELEPCRGTVHLPDADNLELLCPIVAYLWDRTNLAIEDGYVFFLIIFLDLSAMPLHKRVWWSIDLGGFGVSVWLGGLGRFI